MTAAFTVLGAGTWGSVIANHLSGAGHQTTLWHYRQAFADELAASRKHPHLDHFVLHADVTVTADLASAVAAGSILMVAVPSQVVRSVIEQIGPAIADHEVANLSKGIEQGTLLRMSQVIAQAGGLPPERIASVYGPSHAEEVFQGIPTTLVAASTNMAYARRLQKLLSTSNLRVYANDDITGVELGGSIKNVIAIAAGICDGIGFGDNTMAALLTRGLAEATRLGIALGARLETFAGLSGVGDLAVTVYSPHSRNRRLGIAIGQGRTADESMAEMGMVAEGVYTAQSVIDLADRAGVEMPICREVHRVLFEGKPPQQAIRDLMTRDLRDEALA